MRCGHCTAEIPEFAVFCPHCGAQVEGREECTDYHYEAFISYRHRDYDRKVARRLQRRLEGYRIPRHIVTERSERRLGKLFRDQDELPTSSSLSAQIEDALLHSRRLIVVCSPESRASAWVQREVEMFTALHGRKSILLAVAEGEPDECFPPLLLQRVEVAEDGTRTLADEEPLAADFRDMGSKAFASESMRIAAALIGCGYDDLRQRQRQRTVRLVGLVAAVVSTVSIAFGGHSLYQEMRIRHEHEQAQIHESEMLAVEAERLLERGERYQAINVALSALPGGGKRDGRPIVPAAQLMLQRAIGLYPSVSDWSANFSVALEPNAPVGSSKHCMMATSSDKGGVDVIELMLGDVSQHLDLSVLTGDETGGDATVKSLAFSDEGLVVHYGDTVLSIDLSTWEVSWRYNEEMQVSEVLVGKRIVTLLLVDDLKAEEFSHVRLVMCDAKDGRVLQSYDLDGVSFALNDSRVLDINDAGDVVMLSIGGSHEAHRFGVDGSSYRVRLSGDMGMAFRCVGDAWCVLSGEPYFGESFVEAFDSSGKRLWSFEGTSLSSVDRQGMIDAAKSDIIEVKGRGTIAATFSTTMVELDPKTGNELNRADFDKPVLACTFEGNLCLGMLSDGRLFYQSLDTIFTPIGFFYDDLTSDDLVSASFLRCDGFGLFVLGRTIAPEKLVVFRMGDGVVATMMQKKAEELADEDKVWWEGKTPWFEDSDSVGFLDADTFELSVHVDKTRLQNIDWKKAIFVRPLDSGALVGGFARGNSDDLALYRLSDAGKVVAETMLAGAFVGIGEDSLGNECALRLSLDSDGNLLWRTDLAVTLLDGGSLEERASFTLDEGWTIDDVCCGGDTVLVFGHEGTGVSRGHFMLLNRESGDRISCDLDRYGFFLPPLTYGNLRTGDYWSYIANKVVWALGPDAQSVAIVCDDGVTRVFCLADGSLLFEGKEIPSHPRFLSYVSEGGDILVQDERGICTLVSGKDGTMIASTMTSLPPILDCLWMAEVGMLVRYQRNAVTGGEGIALVSVSKDAFGPYLDVPGGLALSGDRSQVLTYKNNSYAIYSILTLEKSVAIANTLVEKHPLSDAEAAYYQVDQSFQGLVDAAVQD